MNIAWAANRVTRTVFEFSASTLSIRLRNEYCPLIFGFAKRWREKSTSSAVTRSPLEKAASRRVKVYSRPLFAISQDSASPGVLSRVPGR